MRYRIHRAAGYNLTVKIRNYGDLAITEARQAALQIAEAGLQAIDTEAVVRAAVVFRDQSLFVRGREFSLHRARRFFVIGVGKCALEAGRAFEAIAGDRITDGVVLDVHEGHLQRIRAFSGTHPMPSERNVDATLEIIRLLKQTDRHDFVLFFISGGGSTLLCQPESFTCTDERAIVECLVRGGADIYKVNTVRKHLSLARGGYLTHHAGAARGVSLIFSDVPGNNLAFVASGPTVFDETTAADARRILDEYRVFERCRMRPFPLLETPKDRAAFDSFENILFVSNELALQMMADKAQRLGLRAHVATESFSGEAREVGRAFARELARQAVGTAFLAGGESTVTLGVRPGPGGRNQEVGLSALPFLPDGACAAAIASDGRDNGPYAGVLVDRETTRRATELRLDAAAHLQTHSTQPFFEAVGDYILTGDTGSNVSDLFVGVRT